MLLSHFKLGERHAKNKGKVTKKMEWKGKRGKKINIKVWLWYQKGREKTIPSYMNELWFLSYQPQQGVVTYLLKPNTYEKNLNLILPDSSICLSLTFKELSGLEKIGESETSVHVAPSKCWYWRELSEHLKRRVKRGHCVPKHVYNLL